MAAWWGDRAADDGRADDIAAESSAARGPAAHDERAPTGDWRAGPALKRRRCRAETSGGRRPPRAPSRSNGADSRLPHVSLPSRPARPRPRTRTLVALLAFGLAACSADPAAPIAPTPTIELTAGGTDSVPPAASTRPATHDVGVLLQDGDEPAADVAGALLRQYAPNADAARLDSLRVLDALRMFTVPLTDAEAAGMLADARVSDASSLPPVSIEAAPVASWAVDRLDQRALPLDSIFAPGATGSGVRIYIVDTGMRATSADYAGRVLPGYDAIANRAATGVDCNGHGTAVASNAAGLLYGVARDAKVVDVRVLDCNGSGSVAGVMAGLDWVLKQKLANRSVPMIVNMSLGGGGCVAFDQAVEKLAVNGVTVVAAAGNSNFDACSVSPARAPSAITVGATDATDRRASFSNFGRCVDVFAPGVDVPGADNASDGGTKVRSGMSMAAPLTAGVAAGYLQLYPTALPEQVAAALTSNATPSVVTNAGSGSPTRLAYVGSLGALPDARVLLAKSTAACVRWACTFDGSASGGAIAAYAWNLGDGRTSTDPRAARTFTKDGTYVVTLTVRDAAGRTSTDADTVRVADRAPTSGLVINCQVKACTFFGYTSTDDGRITRYAWEFGDGIKATGSADRYAHTFAAYGTYTAKLTVTDDVGQTSSSTTRQFTVDAPTPTPRFTARCSSGRTCSFDASATVTVDPVQSYSWSFGDGAASTSRLPTRQYAKAGSYEVRLTVRTTAGKTGSTGMVLTLK